MSYETLKDRIVDAAIARLQREESELKRYWHASKPVSHFFIDDLLPLELVEQCSKGFPDENQLMVRNSIRERKKVGVELDKYDPVIKACLYAFQDSRVVEVVSRITGYKVLLPDPSLYASGISLMNSGDFLNPHLDNSHDGDRVNYRVLNLLYYCSPEWKMEFGGNLELWDRGVINGHTIVSKWNRLVVMCTDQKSWHSVSKVEVEKARMCVSNYLFSPQSLENDDYFHVTTFTGRPEERLKGVILKVDGMARNAIRRAFPKGVVKTKHRIDLPAGTEEK